MSAFDTRSALVTMMSLFIAFVTLGPTASAYELSVTELTFQRDLTYDGEWSYDEEGRIANCTQQPCDLRFQYLGAGFQFEGELANDGGQATVATVGVENPLTVTLAISSTPGVLTFAEPVPYGYHDVVIYNVSSVVKVAMANIIPAPPNTPSDGNVNAIEILPIDRPDGKWNTTSPYYTVRGELQTTVLPPNPEPYGQSLNNTATLKLLKDTELVVTLPKDTGLFMVMASWANRSTYPIGFTAEGKWTSSAPLPWLPANHSTSGVFTSTYRTPSKSFLSGGFALVLALNPLYDNDTTITLSGVSDDNYFQIVSMTALSAENPQGGEILLIGDDPATTSSPPATGTTSRPNGPSDTDLTSTPGSPVSNKTSSAGAIAGGVVGGVVGAALLAFIVFFIMRRRRRQHSPRALNGTIDDDNFQAMRAGSSDAPILNPYHDNSPVESDILPDPTEGKTPTMFTKNPASTPPAARSSEAPSGPSTSSTPARERAPLRTRGVRHDEDAGELEVVPPDELVEDELLPPMYNPSWKARRQNRQSQS